MISAFVSLSSGVFSPHAILLEVWLDESIMHLPLNRAFIYCLSLLFFFSRGGHMHLQYPLDS